MAPLTRAQMKQLAEDALRAVQEWLTAIPRVILNKVGVQVFNPLWQIRRFTIGKLGQTNKANLQILNERRGNIISRFERLVTGAIKAERQLDLAKAERDRMALIRYQLGGDRPWWRRGGSDSGWSPCSRASSSHHSTTRRRSRWGSTSHCPPSGCSRRHAAH